MDPIQTARLKSRDALLREFNLQNGVTFLHLYFDDFLILPAPWKNAASWVSLFYLGHFSCNSSEDPSFLATYLSAWASRRSIVATQSRVKNLGRPRVATPCGKNKNSNISGTAAIQAILTTPSSAYFFTRNRTRVKNVQDIDLKPSLQVTNWALRFKITIYFYNTQIRLRIWLWSIKQTEFIYAVNLFIESVIKICSMNRTV